MILVAAETRKWADIAEATTADARGAGARELVEGGQQVSSQAILPTGTAPMREAGMVNRYG